MGSLIGYIAAAGSLTALYTGFALLLARHRNVIRISGAVLFFSLSAALLLLGLFLGGSFPDYPHLTFTQLPLSLCIGPLLLLFVRSAGDAGFRPGARWLLHFLPAIACVLLLLPLFSLTGAEKLALLNDREAMAALLSHGWLQVVFVVAYATPLIYIFAAARHSRVFFTREPGFSFFHALAAFLSLFALCLALMVAAVFLRQWVWLKHLAAGGFTLAMITAFAALMRTPQFPELLARDAKRYRRHNRVPQSIAGQFDALVDRIEREKLYLQEDIRIGDLAGLAGLRADQLSQLINDRFDMNFNRFLNRYRVREVCRRIEAGDKHSILRIAFECGFNAKSAFNTAFKLETGMNPTEYKRQHRNKNRPES